MISGYTAVHVFTATKAHDREQLGESVSRWLAGHPNLEPVHTVVTQSSDSQFHCLSIVVFVRERA